MMASNVRIAAVSYLNTIPFIYGIRHEGNLRADLLLAPPADCYLNYAEGRADIALMPSAMVPTLKSTSIITDYCIGANGKVRTVELFSNVPIQQVRRIFLDVHSRTSVQLVGYLAANYWHIQPSLVWPKPYLAGAECASRTAELQLCSDQVIAALFLQFLGTP